MKPSPSFRWGRLLGVPLSILALATQGGAVVIDGQRDASGYTERAVQAFGSGAWGAGNVLANLHTAQEGANLSVFIGGRASGNAILVFIDSKSGGNTFIPSNLITSGGEEWTITNFGSSPSAGMTFETGFAPDYAIRIWGDGTAAYVNRYDFTAGARSYAGECGNGAISNSDFIAAAKASWEDASAPYADVAKGVELKLSLTALGVPTGSGQPVKLMAMLVNGGSDWGSNQVLAPKSTDADLTNGMRAFNFETEPGVQTVSLTVDNTDTDGDGTPDSSDTDDDNDGLDDSVETNTGTYVSATDTGTKPLIADSDSDGYQDGAETGGTTPLGFVSDPNKATYASMAAPGSYTTPPWQADGSAGGAMTRVGTGLIDQDQWALNHNFRAIGRIEYKFAANGNWDRNWGDNGNNVAAIIEGTGFHTITFDSATLGRTFSRTTFSDADAFLTAYGLAEDPGGDADGDTISNTAEFTANTDPTNIDTDGDGDPDDTDATPLHTVRDIVFSVNMTAQIALGDFDPQTDGVVVDFFQGITGSQPDLVLSDADNDGIWTGTLTEFRGPAASTGTYKFKNTRTGAPSNGYEGSIPDRVLGLSGQSPQELTTVFFNNVISYSAWAAGQIGGEAANLDHDGDGIPNGVEFFMGTSSNGFTASPQPVGGTVAWPRDPSAGAKFRVMQSADLASWTDVTSSATVTATQVSYTLPSAEAKMFVRLEVTTN